MPPKKKVAATQWVTGPNGTLVEKPVATVPKRGSPAERLTDGLVSFVPPAAITQTKIVRNNARTAAPWEEQIRKDQRLSQVRKEMALEAAAASLPGSRSSSASSARDVSRSPSPSAARSAATPLRPAASLSPSPAPARSGAQPMALSRSMPSSTRSEVSVSPSPAPERAREPRGISAAMRRNREQKEQEQTDRKLASQRPGGDEVQEAPVGARSMAEILREKREREQAIQKPVMPPVLKCMPGSGVGSWVLMPDQVKQALQDASGDHYFELRCSMKMGKMRKMIVKVKDWTAPTGKVALSPSAMTLLSAEASEDVSIKHLKVPTCDLVTFEVSSTVMQSEEEHKAKVREYLEGYGCLNKGEVLRIQEIRFKVLDLGQGVSACAVPVKGIKFKARSDGRLPELKVRLMQKGTLSVGEGMVRVSAAGEGVLTLQAMKNTGGLASTLLYANMGDVRPTLEDFMYGGSNEIQCTYTGSTVFHVLVQGSPCDLHATVAPLAKKEAAPVEHSAVILEHFTRENRVPSPAEIQARLPRARLAKLTCLEKLLTINAPCGVLYTPPHADLWCEALPTEVLAALPIKLRVPLLLQQSSVDADCLKDLEEALDTPEGEDILLHIFAALASPVVGRQQTAHQMLNLLGTKDDIVID